MPKPEKILLVIALSQFVVASPLFAQSASSDAATPTNASVETTDLETVSVQGTRYDARREDTASKIVVGQDELLRYGDTTLLDALKRLPGITVGTGAPGRSGAVSLRGLGDGYTQILINGQKAPAGFDMDSLSPEMIERIEIVRSPTADLRAEAIAGTINIILTNVARRDTNKVSIAWGVTDGKQTPSITWQQSHRDDHRSHDVTATLSRREFLVEESGIEIGWDATGSENLRRSTALRVAGFRDVLSMAPSLNLTMESGDSVALQGYFDASKYHRSVDIDWNTLLGPELRHTQYRQSTGIDVMQLQGSATWNHEFDTTGKITTKLSLGGNGEKYKFREQGYAVDGQQNLEDHTDSDLRVQDFSTTGKYSMPALGNHGLEFGWEGSIDRRRETRTQHLLAVGGAPEEFSDLSFDAKIQRLAFYGQDDLKITPRWSIYMGLRWERIETISDGNGFSSIRNRADVLSPLLQSVWKVPGKENNQVRLAFSRTYKSPTLASLIPRPYTSTNNRELNPDQQGNPDLRPELATGMDVAYEKYWNDGAQISMGAYLREIEGAIRTETHFRNGRWIASPINGGDATVWGVEIDTKFGLPQLIPSAPDIDVRFNATRNWSKVDDVPGPGNRVAEQAKFSSTLGANYKISQSWTTGASFSYRSGGPVRTTSVQIESESVRRDLDIYSLWSLGQKTKLRLSASNLLHQNIDTGEWYFGDDGVLQIERHRLSSTIFRAQLEMQL